MSLIKISTSKLLTVLLRVTLLSALSCKKGFVNVIKSILVLATKVMDQIKYKTFNKKDILNGKTPESNNSEWF